MAKRGQNDPLRYAANLTAAAALVYLGMAALLRAGAARLYTLFHAGATLDNPIAVPEWVPGICNLLLSAVGLWLAYRLVERGVHGTPAQLKISFRLPRRPQLWLFLPVFLGVSLVGSIVTGLLQRALASFTNYTAPQSPVLPQGGFATFLYFLGMCAVPALFEELFVRGAVQGLFARWGTWFSIVVSSVLFTLLHGDIAQMPAVFVSSVLMGLAAHCTGTLATGVALHFANNTMMFCFLYAAQKLDGVSAFALTGYLMAVFCLSAVGCAEAIRRHRVLRMFRPIPRVYDPRNRQSRFERLATAPLFLLTMLGLTVRALAPIFSHF